MFPLIYTLVTLRQPDFNLNHLTIIKCRLLTPFFDHITTFPYKLHHLNKIPQFNYFMKAVRFLIW